MTKKVVMGAELFRPPSGHRTTREWIMGCLEQMHDQNQGMEKEEKLTDVCEWLGKGWILAFVDLF
ncbi:UNVERIFIED_CONTAM: hypothetical protein Sindi_0377600 [Sesamum indicum]